MGGTPLQDDAIARVATHPSGASYEIVLRGRMGRAMVRSLGGAYVCASGPDGTYLVGWYEDRIALQSFLSELGDLGLELTAVRRLEGDER